MALTADEEARTRLLIAAVRKLVAGTPLSQAIRDPDTKRAVQALERALSELVNRLAV